MPKQSKINRPDTPLAPTPEPKKSVSFAKNDKGEVVETIVTNRKTLGGGSVRREFILTNMVDENHEYVNPYDKMKKTVTRTSKKGDVKTKVIERDGNIPSRKVTKK